MKLTQTFFLLAAAAIAVSGCHLHTAADLAGENASVDELFEKMAKDCERSQAAQPGPSSPNWACYNLPTSVDAILRKGTNALPALGRLKHSPPAKGEWALVCIALINVDHFEKTKQFTSRGVTMATYAWVPLASASSDTEARTGTAR